MNIYAPKGTKIKFVNRDYRNWGSCDDPNKFLNIDQIYTIDHTEPHSWHTKVYLQEFPDNKFNTIHFIEVEN